MRKFFENLSFKTKSVLKKGTVAILCTVIVGAGIFYACKKDKNLLDKEVVLKSPLNKLNLITYKFSFRIVLAEKGVSSGFFTFYYIPCTNGCDFYATKIIFTVHTFRKNKKDAASDGMDWWIDTDYIRNDLSSKIINILQGK